MKRLLFILLICFLPLWLQAQNEHLQRDLENAFLNADPKLLEANITVDDYIAEQFLAGNYDAVLEAAPYHLYGRMALVSQIYFSLSEQERTDLSILIEGNLIFHYILSAMVHTNNTDIAGFIYDYLLFVKQLQLRTEQKINYAIKKNGNQQLLTTYAEYRNIKKQLAESHPSPALNRDALQKRLNSLGRQLAQQSNLSLEDDADLWIDIQKRLGNGEAAIEFVRFNVFKGEQITALHQYAAIVVTQHCKTPTFILMPRESSLTYWKTDNPGDLYEVDKYGAALSQLMWLDILTYLMYEDVNTIYFSPVGILNNMAIESFPYDRETLMSYHYNLIRLTSTRQLLYKHNLYPKKTASLYGNLSYRMSNESMLLAASTRSAVAPLPWSKSEVDSIQSILSKQNYVVNFNTQKQGTETSFKAMDGHSPSIIHLATHGFVNRKDADSTMQQSGLLMTYGARAWEGKTIPSDIDDGILTAAEIAALDLSGTDVVVLSGCNTALGDITTEGVWGLQRAFKQAGVQTIVMSLWQIDDEATSILMRYFYEELMKGRRSFAKAVAKDAEIAERIFDYAHGALYTAQNRLRQIPKYSSPYYWAGFIVVE